MVTEPGYKHMGLTNNNRPITVPVQYNKRRSHKS